MGFFSNIMAKAKGWLSRSGNRDSLPPPKQPEYTPERLTLPLDHPHRYASSLTLAERKKRKSRNKMQRLSRRKNRGK